MALLFLFLVFALVVHTEQATLQLSDISVTAGPAGSLDVSTDVKGTCTAGNVSLCEVWSLVQSLVADNTLMRQELDALKSAVKDPDTFLLLHLDVGLRDSSSYGQAVTRSGGAVISSAQPKFGSGSAYFDGSDDKLTINATSNTAVGNGDFTIELWAYPETGADFRYAGIAGTSDHSVLLGNKIETGSSATMIAGAG